MRASSWRWRRKCRSRPASPHEAEPGQRGARALAQGRADRRRGAHSVGWAKAHQRRAHRAISWATARRCRTYGSLAVLADLDIDALVLGDLAGEARHVDLQHLPVLPLVKHVAEHTEARPPPRQAERPASDLCFLHRTSPRPLNPSTNALRGRPVPAAAPACNFRFRLTQVKAGTRIAQRRTKSGSSPREDSMLHQVIETLNARVALRSRYDNFIGGKWVAPVAGQYFDNISPITGKPVCQIARSQAADIELALDAAHKAKDAWGNTAPAKRAEILNKIADRMEENLKVLAAVETIDNGKPIRETTLRRHSARHRPFPLFRRLRPRAGRLAVGDRSRHRRLSLSRAARRGRPDHPVELPDPDGYVEARAGARRGQLRGAEARRADADVDHGADGPDRRSPAARRAQRGQRLRRRGRQAARPEQAHRQGGVHRRDHDRAG